MFRFHRPRIRALWVRCLLGLWLFTLAQGFAHACLLQGTGTDHVGLHATVPAHASEHEHDHSSTSEELCVKACDDLKDSLILKSTSWAGDTGPALATTLAAWQPPCPQLATVSRVHSPPGARPPISIRFLRLTL